MEDSLKTAAFAKAAALNKEYLAAIHPFIAIFRAYGIDLATEASNSKPAGKAKTCLQWFVTLVLFVLPCLFAGFFLANITFDGIEIVGWCLVITMLTMSGVTSVTIACLAFKRRTIQKLVAKINYLSLLIQQFQTENMKKIKIISWILVLVPYIAIVMSSAFFTVYSYVRTSNDSLTFFFDEIMTDAVIDCKELLNETRQVDPDRCDVMVTVGLGFIGIMWALVVLSCLCHAIGLMLIMNNSLYYLFESLKQTYHHGAYSRREAWVVIQRYNHNSSENVRNYIRLHKEICEIVRIADTTFRQTNFAISAAEMLVIIMTFRGMDFTRPSANQIVVLTIPCIYSISYFIAQTICAAKVNSQHHVSTMTPKKNSILAASLGPFVAVFRIYGLNLNSAFTGVEGPGTKIGYRIAGVLFTAWSLLLTVVSFKTVQMSMADVFALSVSLVSFVWPLSVTVASFMIPGKRDHFKDVLTKLNTVTDLIVLKFPKTLKRVRAVAYVSVVIPVLTTLGHTLYMVIILGVNTPTGEEHEMQYIFPSYNNSIFQCHDSSRGPYFQRCQWFVILIAENFLWLITVHSLVAHYLGFTYVILFTLTSLFESIEQQYSEREVQIHLQSTTLDGEHQLVDDNVRHFIRMHKDACKMVKSADNTFRHINFILSAAEMLTIVMALRSGLDRRNDTWSIIKALIPGFVYTLTFIGRTKWASMVNYKVLVSLKVMLKVTPTEEYDCPSAETAKTIQEYVKHVQMSPPALTGWGLYTIEDGCILTIAGYILTYTLTLYGIN